MKYSAVILALLAAVALANPAPAAAPEITPAPEAELVAIREAEAKCPAATCKKLASSVKPCGRSCISSAAKRAGCGTVTTNFSCQCAHSSAINSYAEQCVINACGIPKAISVASEVNSVCACNSAHPYTSC